ncbi:hypothetical protein [Rhizobium sp. Root1220]|uniref:hypothetical protein n=1 Tax=Rhizobium sp. Root1220 TaxID=1736432 RepID=UPI0012E380BC|nr:hypothetical protein [Rhizobium sp. Root1220]
MSLLAATFFVAPPTFAADLAPAFAPQPSERDPDHWTFSFAPYLWAAGVTGDTGVFGLPEVHTDQTFGDILADIDFGFMGAGDAHYGKYSLFTDISYARITTSSATVRGVLADEVKLKTETFTAMVGAGYTVLESQDGKLDVVGAVKLWSTETTISLSGGPLGGASARDDATWVDGLAGLRGTYSITPTIYLTGWGMIGAGGADLDWDAMAGIGYKWKDSVSAIVGYRALGVDYSNGSLTSDIIQHGPIIGAAFHF